MPRTFLVALLLLPAIAAHAQTAAPPPTPYQSPITGFVGRFLDSTSTPDRATYPRTNRALKIKIAPERDRVYMIMSESLFVGQRLSTFAQRVATETMQTAPTGEKFLAFEEQFDAEAPGSGWPTGGVLEPGRLFDFDWDDRGLTYLAYGSYGWGILDSQLHVVSTSATTGSPQAVLSFRSAGHYYALVGDSYTTYLYDVTNPAAPVFVRNAPDFSAYAKSAGGNIAVNFNENIEIHTSTSLANGSAAVSVIPRRSFYHFTRIATDGTNFYATCREAGLVGALDEIHIIQPSGAGYADIAVPDIPIGATSIAYGGGYLAVGFLQRLPRTAALYRAGSGGLTLLDDTYLSYAQYPIPQPVLVNGRLYLLVAANGLGEVFTLDAATASAPSGASALTPFGLLALIALLAITALTRRGWPH